MNYTDNSVKDELVHITLPMCDRTVSAESSGDYTLPDYQPEIRRLLCVDATVLPPAKYVGGTGAEFNGTVDYRIMYVGMDGGIYSAPLSSEYSFNVPIDGAGDFDLGEGVSVLASVVCENAVSKVTAPRRLNIKSRLRAHVRVFGKRILEAQCIGAESHDAIMRLRGEGRCMSVGSGSSDIISITEEIGGMSDDVRVISAEGDVFVDDVRAAEGIVRASGNVMLKLMSARENCSPEISVRKLPFEGEIEVDGACEQSMCRATGTVSDISVSVGEDGRILCDISLILEARAMQNEEFTHTADLYSTEESCICEHVEYSMPIALGCTNSNVSQSERIPLEQTNISPDANIIYACGAPRFDNCTLVGEKYMLTGECRYTLICESGGEYSSSEIVLPVRYEMSADGEVSGYDAQADVISCRARVDGENLCIDAELSVVAELTGAELVRTLSEARFGEKYDCRGNRMTVYYPSDGDSVWTVAKRYHVRPESVRELGGYYLV